jgi:uncharacterized membrane protein/mono/diheme cytochrome c family protein
MKFTVKRVAENLLFAADIFILFLVLFESRLHIPYWLQPVGRMHPLLLHFPIVILLLAMGMEFLRFRSNYQLEVFYQSFTTSLLLVGTLSAAVTVVMGLILAKEPGYTGSAVAWHKWTGIAIVLISSLVYWYRNSKWYKASVAKISAVVTCGFLIAAGHLGAGITHGSDFITEPIMAQYAVAKMPLDKAFIYADLVQPILAAKCVSCHNPDKSKGSLLLDTPENIMKGGKHGKLFVKGNADSSLMMQRIYLPEEDKKHMPLADKPQLTKEEIEILARWIQSGAPFKKKVIDLPPNDSLRLVAAKFLAPAEAETYDFAAADENTLKKLSNNYRVISAIAEGSPALAANFYNKTQYSSKALEELKEVQKQIIELNLNKMPVKDADLKTIGQMENLRTLNLSFTDITGEGLSQLATLKYLHSLSLSGTKVTYKTVQPVTKMKSLKEIFVWNTGLKREEIAQLQTANKKIQIIEGYKDDGVPIQLNAPILLTTKSVFTDTVHVAMKHPISKVQLRYTLDGSRPDSLSSLYNGDLVINNTAVFKARAFKDGWIGSDSIMFNFYKSSLKPDTIEFISLPEEKYKGEGAKTLVDRVVGDVAFYSGKWLGYQKDMAVGMNFFTPVKISSVMVHLVKNTGAGVFPPTQIQIWGGKDKAGLKLLQTTKLNTSAYADNSVFLVECKFKPADVSFVKVVIVSTKDIIKGGITPNKPAWLFVDELFLN